MDMNVRASDYFLIALPIIAASAAQAGSLWRPAKVWPYLGLVVTILALACGMISLIVLAPAYGIMRAVGMPYSPTLRSEVALFCLITSTCVAVAWLAILVNLSRMTRRSQVIRSERTQHGEARFARWPEVQKMSDHPGFLLGVWSKRSEKLAAALGADTSAGSARFGDDAGHILRWGGAGSLLSFSPPGGGKSSSIAIPTLIDYPGPVVVHDPKGENAIVAVRARRLRGHRVAVLNPYGISALGTETDSINVVDYLRYGTDCFSVDCKRLAAAIVEKSKAGTSNPHFEQMATNFVAGILGFLVDANRRWVWPYLEDKAQDGTITRTRMKPLPASLAGLYDFLNIDTKAKKIDEELLDKVFAAIATDPNEIGGNLSTSGAVAWTKLKASDEKASHFSTLTRFLSCFGDPGVRRCSDTSTIDLHDLRSDSAPVDIFLCVPQGVSEHCAAWLRAIITTVTAVVIDGKRPPQDVLLLLDEMPALGQMDAIMTPTGTGALALGRSAGLRIWAIVQSLSQLRATWGPDGYQTWTSGCSVVTFSKIGGFDKETAEYISGLLGEYTIEVDDISASRSGRSLEVQSDSKSKSIRDAGRRLLRIEEVAKLPDSIVICTVNDGGADGKHPILLDKIRYWERPEWDGWTDKNPFVRV